jgi:hypothetical protein
MEKRCITLEYNGDAECIIPTYINENTSMVPGTKSTSKRERIWNTYGVLRGRKEKKNIRIIIHR